MVWVDYVVYTDLILVLCLFILLVSEHFRFITETAGQRQGQGSRKKGVAEKKPSIAELEAMVRQMFPERPEPDERSQARAVVVEVVKGSARGLFALLPEEACVRIVKQIAGAGQGCPRCGEKKELGSKEPGYREHYTRRKCKACAGAGRTATFYELTGTIFENSHLSARQWLWGMYLFVGGCSTREIGIELDVTLKSGQRLVRLLQLSLITVRYRFMLQGQVEFDEVYLIGGLKGQAGKIKLERAPRKRGKRQPGRGTWQSDKVPILGMLDRQGHIYLVPCANVQTETIQFLIEYLTELGAKVYTDSYNIYNFLRRVGYQHQQVNHSKREYARGQVHVNTVEGLWSLLRDHLRIHRGVSKLYLPLYVMRFEFLVNHRGENRYGQMMELCALACQADGTRLRRLVREKQVHTACPTLGLGQVV
jgi:transposase-like protein